MLVIRGSIEEEKPSSDLIFLKAVSEHLVDAASSLVTRLGWNLAQNTQMNVVSSVASKELAIDFLKFEDDVAFLTAFSMEAV
jgi:hypothetical protein